MKHLIYLLLIGLFVTSCERFDEDVIVLTGLYEANIIGVSGPHTISVAYESGDELWIEAPFDGNIWSTIFVDIDDQEDFIKDIDIPEQQIGTGIFLWGDGFYNEGVMQLDYTIVFGGIDIYDFRLLGSQN